ASQVRTAYRNWLGEHAAQWNSPVAVTLTLKQGASAPAGGVVPISIEDCRRTVRAFGRALDRRFFGRSARRFKKRRLNKIFALEHSNGGRWHYHALIEPPPGVPLSEFAASIRECWLATEWGHREMDIEAHVDAGWLDYCLKLETKDALDYWSDGVELV